jgi:hypothetical protein
MQAPVEIEADLLSAMAAVLLTLPLRLCYLVTPSASVRYAVAFITETLAAVSSNGEAIMLGYR